MQGHHQAGVYGGQHLGANAAGKSLHHIIGAQPAGLDESTHTGKLNSIKAVVCPVMKVMSAGRRTTSVNGRIPITGSSLAAMLVMAPVATRI
jgi:hypothetical protein